MSSSGGIASAMARAPLRVSLAGGGTDLPSYASRFGGLVIAVAMTRYVGVTAHPRSFTGDVRSALEELETVPRAEALRNPFARAALLRSGVTSGIEVSSFGDVPSGTGLGGSAAFTVAMLHALHGTGSTSELAPRQLADQASAIEMIDLGRPVGVQDHYTSAFGGALALRIGAGARVDVERLAVDDALAGYVANRLLLFFTGRRRDAGVVLAAQENGTDRGQEATLRALHGIRSLATDMLDVLRAGKFDDIGRILDEHWRLKRRLSCRVSADDIDRLYDCGMAAGAQGGKLLGAGGGGFILLAVRKETADEVRQAMLAEGAQELTFGLDRQGSRVTRIGPAPS